MKETEKSHDAGTLGKGFFLACYIDFVMMGQATAFFDQTWHCAVYTDAIIFIIREVFFTLLFVPYRNIPQKQA